MRDQAKYIAESIGVIMKKFERSAKFTIIAHSIGGGVSYYSTLSKKFPVSQLANIITLATPLEYSPLYFNRGGEAILDKIYQNVSNHLVENVVHINIHGGARDFLVNPEISNYNRFNQK